MAIRLTALAFCASALFLAQASIADTAHGQQEKAPPKPVPKAPPPTQWWCELSAQPASGVLLTAEEKDHPFFISQVITIPRPLRTTEDDIERRCRVSFAAQFGTRFDVITARAYFAITSDEADHDRLLDMGMGVRHGHTKEFRMSEP
jgi:hypothetical protein